MYVLRHRLQSLPCAESVRSLFFLLFRLNLDLAARQLHYEERDALVDRTATAVREVNIRSWTSMAIVASLKVQAVNCPVSTN